MLGSRFARLASEPVCLRFRRRPLKLPRRFHSSLRNQNWPTTNKTLYSSRRIKRTTPRRRTSVSARSSKTRKTSWKCAKALAIDWRVLTFPGSAPTRPKNCGALILSQMASTRGNFVKVCSIYSGAWILNIRTSNNFVSLYNRAPHLSPHSRRAPQNCRRAPILTF